MSGAPDDGAAPRPPPYINRDGFKVADMEYYDLLAVRADATDLELKKAYRKAAIKNHPDKGGDEETFKVIGEAYRVLADNNLRADYDKHGKKKPTDEVGIHEATEMFGNLFGGERFVDYIGELSMFKNMTKSAEILMTDEEREEAEAALRGEKENQPPSQSQSSQSPQQQHQQQQHLTGEESKPESDSTGAAASATATATAPEGEKQPPAGEKAGEESASELEHAKKTKEKENARKSLTPEQKAKLEELDREQEAEQEKRISDLAEKLTSRIRPFVEAKRPGDKDDPETQLFEKRMREEAEDLKLESFGVELLHAIGGVYLTKSSIWIKSHKNAFLGVIGFVSRLREKGSVVKETWGLLGSAVSAQMSMDDLARRQERGDLPEEELRQLEEEMNGKMLLATWRTTKWEISGVLRKVLDRVLNEDKVDKKTLLNRAKAIAFLGAIYKQVQPDLGNDEQRELERLMANAQSKKHKRKAAAAAPPPPPAT